MTKPAVPKVPSVRPVGRTGLPQAGLRWWVRVHAKALGLLSAGGGGIAAGGATAGLVGALAAGALVLAAGYLLILWITLAGFARDQQTLTQKGGQVATNAAEVCAVMHSNAVAYDAVLRGLSSAGPFRREPPAYPPGAVDRAVPAPRPAVNGTRHPAVAAAETADEVPGKERPPPAGQVGRRPGPTFWQLLTDEDRHAFSRAARLVTFRGGTFLCRQGERADHALVIMSGWVRVLTEDEDGTRVIAVRGPGDLIGERAVMMLRRRSATVAALEDVQALQVPDESFAAFLRDRPRVNALLEHQVYQRLTEDRDTATLATPEADWTGQICPIVLTDITAFGSLSRNDVDRLSLRRVMYSLLPEAFGAAGLSWHDCYREDRGDGTLIVVPPHVPGAPLLQPALSHLARELRRYNEQAAGPLRMQLRVALHAGPIVRDQHGMTGNAINHSARLVQAKVLGQRLRRTGADLGVITSAYFYDNVIKQHGGPPPGAGSYDKVRFQAKESAITAWIHLAHATDRLPAC